MKDYARIAAKIRQTPWLITAEGLDLILTIMDARIQNGKLTDEEIIARLEAAPGHGSEQSSSVNNGIGVLPVYGPIFGKANLMTELSGATSMEAFRSDLKSMLADDSIHSIIMDIDSPGGTSEMVPEAGQEIFAGRDIKPIYAIANNMSGSAAYWLGSQASTFYTAPSGSVGSIGVYTVHEDHSSADYQKGVRYTYISAAPYKTEGNPHEALSKEGEQFRQEIVDELYGEFLQAVAVGRGTTAEMVRTDFGEGRMLSAKKALASGMVDGIMELDTLVESIANQARTPQTVRVSFGDKVMNATLTSNGTYTWSTDSTNPKLESAEWEHSEPGTGNPPIPAQSDDIDKDKAIVGGWRRDPLPLPISDPKAPQPNSRSEMAQELSLSSENIEALCVLFGVDNEADLMAAINAAHQTSSTLAGAVSLSSEEDKMKREFPNMYEEWVENRKINRETRAKAFVESVSRITTPHGDTSKGLSSLAKDTLESIHMKFAEGSANISDFENAINAVTQGGVVPLAEAGSSNPGEEPVAINTSTAEGVQQNRQLFAAKITELIENDSLDYSAAIVEATKRYPDLAKAYRATVPA